MRPGIFFSPRRRKGRVAPVSPSFKKHPTNSPPCQTDSAMRRKGQPLPRDRHSALPAQCLRSQDGLHSATSCADSPCRPFVFTQCREETKRVPKARKTLPKLAGPLAPLIGFDTNWRNYLRGGKSENTGVISSWGGIVCKTYETRPARLGIVPKYAGLVLIRH